MEDSPSRSVSANVAEDDLDEEFALFMLPAEESDGKSISESTTITKESQSSNASMVPESSRMAEELSGVGWSETSSLANVDLDSVTAGDKAAVQIKDDGGTRKKLAKIVDSCLPAVGHKAVPVDCPNDGCYAVDFSGYKYEVSGLNDSEVANVANEVLTLEKFHRRMGHIPAATARQMIDQGMVTGIRIDEESIAETFFCEPCEYAKATRRPMLKAQEGGRAGKFGVEVHMDLSGPIPVETKGGQRYYVSFVDDATSFTHLYFLRAKSDVFYAYRKYEAWCEKEMKTCVQILCADRRGECVDKKFGQYLKKRGTKYKLTVYETPAHTGVAEYRNRVILEHMRAFLHSSGLPKDLWAKAARHAVWLLNRVPTKAVDGRTPYEAVFGKKPDFQAVREWGEKVSVSMKKGYWMGINKRNNGVHILAE